MKETLEQVTEKFLNGIGVRDICDDTSVLFEMANFSKIRHPELPSNIWISSDNAPHGPRIKIQKNKGNSMQPHDTFSMTIANPPQIIGNAGRKFSQKDIKYFEGFIIKNMDVLIAYWNSQIDTETLIEKLVF